MRLVQYRTAHDHRAVAVVDAPGPAFRSDAATVYELALDAIESGRPLVDVARERLTDEQVDLDAAEADGRLLPPLDHPVPTRCWITGTGLTHLGGAKARAEIHRRIGGVAEGELTDSLLLYKWGVEQGKPADGGPGVQPEWFFKGNGASLVAPGHPLPLLDFALDASEEPEIVGLYIIDEDGTPCRLGFSLGNEMTDHELESRNFLYLASAKLRPCSVGPELLLGPLPAEVHGTSRILRDGAAIWERPFLSGEANMSHRLSGLEHHQFKYPLFRRPGDVHIHFFGTSTASFAEGVRTRPGDVFEVSSPVFGRTLRNPLARVETTVPTVRAL